MISEKLVSSEIRVVLTGGNSGIGLEAAKSLYGKGYNIIFGSRNTKKNEEAIDEIKKAHPSSKGSIISYKLDQS